MIRRQRSTSLELLKSYSVRAYAKTWCLGTLVITTLAIVTFIQTWCRIPIQYIYIYIYISTWCPHSNEFSRTLHLREVDICLKNVLRTQITLLFSSHIQLLTTPTAVQVSHVKHTSNRNPYSTLAHNEINHLLTYLLTYSTLYWARAKTEFLYVHLANNILNMRTGRLV